jgi:hypothetical protein
MAGYPAKEYEMKIEDCVKLLNIIRPTIEKKVEKDKWIPVQIYCEVRLSEDREKTAIKDVVLSVSDSRSEP